MNSYVQLGTAASFVAPASGQLVLLCCDNYRADNSGELVASISGPGVPGGAGSFTARCQLDSPGPFVVGGCVYTCSVDPAAQWMYGDELSCTADGLGEEEFNGARLRFGSLVAIVGAHVAYHNAGRESYGDWQSVAAGESLFPAPCRALYVGVAGALSVASAAENVVDFGVVAAGAIIAVAAIAVAADSTAGGLVALY